MHQQQPFSLPLDQSSPLRKPRVSGAFDLSRAAARESAQEGREDRQQPAGRPSAHGSDTEVATSVWHFLAAVLNAGDCGLGLGPVHVPESGQSVTPCARMQRATFRISLREPRLLSVERYPVLGWVGVAPVGLSRSKPSGVFRLPGPVPGWSVWPYCQTSAPVAGSIATIRSL